MVLKKTESGMTTRQHKPEEYDRALLASYHKEPSKTNGEKSIPAWYRLIESQEKREG